MIFCNNNQPVVLVPVDSYFMPVHVKQFDQYFQKPSMIYFSCLNLQPASLQSWNKSKFPENCVYLLSKPKLCSMSYTSPQKTDIVQMYI